MCVLWPVLTESAMISPAIKDRLQRELEEYRHLEAQLASPDLAEDPDRLREVSRDHARLSGRAERIESFLNLLQRMVDAEAILAEESDDELKEMAREELNELRSEAEARRQEVEALLVPPDPNSGKNVIMEIRAGTGGEEAALFASELLKMYTRFSETQGYRLELLNVNESEIGGIKEAVFSVAGETAYDLLHQEGGAHRVQRIPVTESGGRIHTSAVTVAVMPEAEEAEVAIDDKDLEIGTFRASGAGGQHVNKTDSAVRILHVPSGIVVSCQDERSQHKNKAKALRVLRSRLAERQAREAHEESAAEKKKQVGSGDRSEKIRTYNFPQGRITDHRIGHSVYNMDAFLAGEMSDMLERLVAAEREEKLKAMGVS